MFKLDFAIVKQLYCRMSLFSLHLKQKRQVELTKLLKAALDQIFDFIRVLHVVAHADISFHRKSYDRRK